MDFSAGADGVVVDVVLGPGPSYRMKISSAALVIGQAGPEQEGVLGRILAADHEGCVLSIEEALPEETPGSSSLMRPGDTKLRQALQERSR
jgi:hypothetical protein